MCHFIMIAVAERHREAIEALGRGRAAFGVDSATNPSALRLFAPGDAVYVLTRGGCSCELYSEPSEPTTEEDAAADRARYRRKGWSEAKIARAIEAKARPHKGANEHRRAFHAAISSIVQRFGSARLFAHMYDGRIDNEEIGSAGCLRMPLADFDRQEGAFLLDTLVDVVTDAG